ncbi:transcriptional regulator [Cryobacterium sp. Hh11]|uniref:transcriptional regulator n=1 Tax=Cryobacterium sp. Hh11 TaxID=2555868 RepID=UPI00106AB966|nr:transcriptional regulator [Cryobacterium sp. Hh11]TFD51629.1 transcriptional regulator [Cryobacterium sp. Hh11]
MAQVTWRTSDELVKQVQNLALAEGLSMNEFLNRVMTVAAQSDESDPLAARLRNRLRAAGLLATGTPNGPRPSGAEIARARAAAGSGVPLSEIVSTMRE